jgi:hypothetical protein
METSADPKHRLIVLKRILRSDTVPFYLLYCRGLSSGSGTITDTLSLPVLPFGIHRSHSIIPEGFGFYYYLFQCCGSGMFIPDPDFYPSGIPDPGSKNRNKREGEKNCCHTFFCSHRFHKIVNYFMFETLKKQIWANFQRIIEIFTQKIVTKLSKYGFGIRDPRSGILGSKRHRIPDLDPQH